MKKQMARGPTVSDRSSALKTLNLAPAVQIDTGTFKYVLIEAKDPETGAQRQLVRGALRAPYHKDVARPTVHLLQQAGCLVRVLGGGRICHDPTALRIEVFGHSYGFGAADHHCTRGLILGDRLYQGYTVEVTDQDY